MGKATTRYAVQCNSHGMTIKNLWKAVFVGKPTSRGGMLKNGCPICKAEKSKASK